VLLSLKPLRRVRDVQRASHAVANGDLTVRLPVDRSHDELDDLAQIVNVMMDEVERLMGQAKSFGEAVAHELRTPLTRLRASLDHAAQGLEGGDPRKALMETCVAETDSLLSRFRALLRIAAVEARNRQSRIAEVRLSAIVEQVGELYAPLAVARGIALRVDVEPEVSARADGELMFEAISNLVDNGLKFTPAGGSVHLTLSPSEDGPIVEVRDSGIGIPADDVALITKRFYRSANVGHIQGHGLGLSLVAAVADMHGFELAIGDAAPGALFRILCRPRGPSPFSVAG
jgi:signal transduction histidine kinase